ncbi:MAG: hypothetical protein QGG17_06500 [Rhodospirillales bacterium]|jgi:hypothetical protein|nr:hypothetical protein [Rhodospirillales bacterium]MDP6804914.1 hypothetical protein [Rhodospirillales bacterium]
MDSTRISFVFCVTLLVAWPAAAVDWQLVVNNNTTLWYDDDSYDWDDDDYIYFEVYHGTRAGAGYMSANSVELSYDCWVGDAYVWNPITDE